MGSTTDALKGEETRQIVSDAAGASLPGTTEAQRRAWGERAEGQSITCDLVVVGGGLGGVAAAIAAARRGMDVVILEETHMLGGQATTSGVSAMDVTTYYARSLGEHGLWSELVRRIRRIYDDELRRPCNTARYKDDSFAPNVVVIERVLGEWAAEEGIRVFRNAPLVAVERGVSSILITCEGIEARGALAIDATEMGELLGAAGVAHRLGNRVVAAAAGAPTGLDDVMIQDITMAAIVRRYDAGLPEWAKVSEEPPEYKRFRRTTAASYPDSPNHQFTGPNAFAGYRATPDLASEDRYDGLAWERITKTALNFHNDQPVAASYLVDAEARKAADRLAILRSLAIIHYLQVELGLPWGIADDDGFDRGRAPREVPEGLEAYAEMLQHLPVRPYIREARRLLGRVTLTGKDIFRRSHHLAARWDVDAIAVGTYPPDLHGGRKPEHLERDLDESLSDKPSVWREGPFAIPLGTLIPRDGGRVLAAEKNISASRIAAGAVRLHPTAIATGEAVGVLAALAISSGTMPDAVPTAAVQISLADGGALLSPVQIRGLERTHPAFVPISMAVCRRLLDWTYVRPQGDPAPEAWVDVDLERAATLGSQWVAAHEAWRKPVRESALGDAR